MARKTFVVGSSLLLASMLFLVSCGSLTDSKAKTAQEFVEKYSKAYQTGDAGAIVKMTLPGKGQSEESLKKDIETDIGRHGFEYVAWTHTRYVSEVDHGKYIHVNVEVEVAPSVVILVRQDGLLKVALDPGSYE